MKYPIDSRILKAMLNAALKSNDPTRCALQSVYVEFCPNGVRYVATSGRMLACLQTGTVAETPEATLLLPEEAIKTFYKAKADEVEFLSESGLVSYFVKGQLIGQVRRSEMQFPSWRMVMPKRDGYSKKLDGYSKKLDGLSGVNPEFAYLASRVFTECEPKGGSSAVSRVGDYYFLVPGPRNKVKGFAFFMPVIANSPERYTAVLQDPAFPFKD